MISNLLILNSAYNGARDLWWVDDPLATAGYNIYRAFDYPTNWAKLNSTPLPGHFYRDQTSYTTVQYSVQPGDWVEQGELGKYIIKLPEIPYSTAVAGRAKVANSPDDVTITIDGVNYRPSFINGLDRTVFFDRGFTLPINGSPSTALTTPIPNFSTANITVTYSRLSNFVDIYLTMTRTFYTVVSVGAGGELYAPGANGVPVVNSQELDKLDYMQAEMVRRNAWVFEQVGEPAYLMFRKTKGTKCGCTQGGIGQPRTNCSSCYETGIVGGYYGPYDFLFVDPDTALVRTINEGGVKTERGSRSYLGRTPIVQNGDLIVRRTGDRMVITNVVYKSPRGVILQQDFEVELLTREDTRYLIPVIKAPVDVNGNPVAPIIYNPATESNPNNGVGGAEPVVVENGARWYATTSYGVGQIIYKNGYQYQVTTAGITGSSEPTWNQALNSSTTDNTVVWSNIGMTPETSYTNPDQRPGRTITFGRIEG